MNNEYYFGWTNYETWRVNNVFLYNNELSFSSVDELKTKVLILNYVQPELSKQELLIEDDPQTHDKLLSIEFLSNVNWEELYQVHAVLQAIKKCSCGTNYGGFRHYRKGVVIRFVLKHSKCWIITKFSRLKTKVNDLLKHVGGK